MNILIVKTSAIGDVTHTLPSLHALRAHYPEAHITWLVEEAAADIIKGHAALDRVLVSRRKSWVGQLKRQPFSGVVGEICGFLKELRDTEYDLIIDFQSLLKSGVLIGLAHGKRKVGYGRGMEHAECSYIFLNEKIPPVAMDRHAVRRELHLLEEIGVAVTGEIVFDLPIGEKNRAQVDELLAGYRIGLKQRLVAINPMATWPTKLWEPDRFTAVADRLLDQGLAVVFTGSQADRPVIDEILAGMRRKAINLAGQTSLKNLAALYEKAVLVISTDTGPMHIAATVGTPVLALFGPTAPWRTGPFGDKHRVLRLDLPCSPCLQKQCETRQCMKEISVEQVMEAAEEMTGTP